MATEEQENPNGNGNGEEYIPSPSPSTESDRYEEEGGKMMEDEKYSWLNYSDIGYESGTEEEQIMFMRELELFHRERCTEFKPPKFYGEMLNLLKLFRSVVRLGGYEHVTACKTWRTVGEAFRPPKTCTTVSWTFRCFYEKETVQLLDHRFPMLPLLQA
nr:AT-rich interactive domain-containing protein 6-like isoform X1 [Tanacetum cinerariifolium]GEY57315.1 AT-rich interactive domain-containing protein 6-like isoform X1 [Tanacetum cinerariifolium]